MVKYTHIILDIQALQDYVAQFSFFNLLGVYRNNLTLEGSFPIFSETSSAQTIITSTEGYFFHVLWDAPFFQLLESGFIQPFKKGRFYS